MKFTWPWPLLAVMGILGGVLLLAPLWYGVDPLNLDLMHLMQSPAWAVPLGTDELGRDVLARLAMGVRLSVGVGLAVVLVAGTVGVTVGLLSGYLGGWVDMVLMRVTDVFLSFPGILIAIAFAALAGPGVGNVVAALCLMGWVGFARLARAQTLSLRREEFVQAARVCGTPGGVIMARHILPNIAAPLIVEAVFAMAGAMIAEAGLSFLGIGVQPPAPSLGSMLREGARYMLVAPHLVLAPGLVLMLLVLALNLLGDQLRDKLDAHA